MESDPRIERMIQEHDRAIARMDRADKRMDRFGERLEKLERAVQKHEADFQRRNAAIQELLMAGMRMLVDRGKETDWRINALIDSRMRTEALFRASTSR